MEEKIKETTKEPTEEPLPMETEEEEPKEEPIKELIKEVKDGQCGHFASCPAGVGGPAVPARFGTPAFARWQLVLYMRRKGHLKEKCRLCELRS